MKQILLSSFILTVVVFVLPLASMPSEPLVNVGQALSETDGAAASETSAYEPSPEPEPEPAATAASLTPRDADIVITARLDGQDTDITLDEYLWGVLAGEIPPSFPAEALRTQAVAARTFVLYTLEHPKDDGVHPDAVLCDNPAHCQAYIPRGQAVEDWGAMADTYAGSLELAVSHTDGQIMVYAGHPILAAYHSTSSGKTERAADVWGQDVPYLQSVDSPGEQDAPRYQARFEVTADEFWDALGTLYPDIARSDTPFGTVTRSDAGGVISIEVSGVPVSGADMRTLFGLNSSNFTVALMGGDFRFDTLGFGHGVGLPQYGARAMALEGKEFDDILCWYYRGAELALYDPETREAFAVIP